MISRPWLDEQEAPLTGKKSGTTDQAPSSPRRQRVYLWAAPIQGEELPRRESFVCVKPAAISGQRITFAWVGEFPWQRTMLAIGTKSEAAYLLGEVLSQRYDTQGRLLVECGLVERYESKKP
ncbi:MAG: hypothetical protein SFX18_11140 [Pirellulales bacterium]|nr:hypothetical protein [Pirellulales bacterium]